MPEDAEVDEAKSGALRRGSRASSRYSATDMGGGTYSAFAQPCDMRRNSRTLISTTAPDQRMTKVSPTAGACGMVEQLKTWFDPTTRCLWIAYRVPARAPDVQ
jgi:hypothetical protein